MAILNEHHRWYHNPRTRTWECSHEKGVLKVNLGTQCEGCGLTISEEQFFDLSDMDFILYEDVQAVCDDLALVIQAREVQL